MTVGGWERSLGVFGCSPIPNGPENHKSDRAPKDTAIETGNPEPEQLQSYLTRGYQVNAKEQLAQKEVPLGQFIQGCCPKYKLRGTPRKMGADIGKAMGAIEMAGRP